MYYRIAIQGDAQPPWKWQSTALSSLNIVLQWLQVYRAFPHERLRIFSSPSREGLNEQLVRENQGLESTSVPATQFLQERRIAPRGAVREAGAGGSRAHERTTSIPAETGGTPNASCMSPLDKRREELERGAGGDHDLPYKFTLPTAMPQVLAWVKLLARVQQGDFQPEVGAGGERQQQHRHPGGPSTPTYALYGKDSEGNLLNQGFTPQLVLAHLDEEPASAFPLKIRGQTRLTIIGIRVVFRRASLRNTSQKSSSVGYKPRHDLLDIYLTYSSD